MGLSKPVIITSSAVDTSNLATKSDLTTLANTVTSSVGAVKSVQRGTMGHSLGTSKTVSGKLMGNNGYDTFYEVTISSVNTAKSTVHMDKPGDSSWLGVLVNSTKLRIYCGNKASSSGSEYMGAISWQVVEYK